VTINPGRVNSVMKLLSMNKETEGVAKLRLAPPHKALPAPRKKTADSAKKLAVSLDISRLCEEEKIPF
jgi:hypothetical protein